MTDPTPPMYADLHSIPPHPLDEAALRTVDRAVAAMRRQVGEAQMRGRGRDGADQEARQHADSRQEGAGEKGGQESRQKAAGGRLDHRGHFNPRRPAIRPAATERTVLAMRMAVSIVFSVSSGSFP